jgi:hypothetical protein
MDFFYVPIMSKAKEEPMVPEQKTGNSSDTEASVSFNSEQKAKQFYEVVKQRLLQVNNWQKWAGAATARFQLTDATGIDVQRTVQQGDHFKIDIPGPGPVTGDGYDWVHVEQVEEKADAHTEHVSIQVRPATNPNNSRHDVAHFFSEDASSCFIAKRDSNTVTAAVHGRNEKPNTHAETLVDKARNAAVATGAVAAFSKLQWKSLVNGLVKQD